MRSHTTDLLIERLGIEHNPTITKIEIITQAIRGLAPFKFATGVHTTYVRAVSELSGGHEGTVLRAKIAVNETAFKPKYDIKETSKKACGCHLSCVSHVLNENKFYCTEGRV